MSSICRIYRSVLPAGAGVILARDVGSFKTLRFTRRRGGDPIKSNSIATKILFYPQARG